MTKISIYALLDPDTQDVRYVGKATNPHKRFRAHLNEKGNTRKCRWIAKLVSARKEPILKILEIIFDNWQDRECFWIKYYSDLGFDLCNLTKGGEGLSEASLETRQKLSSIRKEIWKTDRTRQLEISRSPERANKISKALTGKPKTKEHVSKLPQNQSGGLTHSEESKIKISNSLIGNQYAKGSKRTPEQIEIIRKASLGRKYPNRKPMPEYSNIARSNTLKGKPKSPEWKEKLRQGALRRWSNSDEKQKQSDRIKKVHQMRRSVNSEPKRSTL